MGRLRDERGQFVRAAAASEGAASEGNAVGGGAASSRLTLRSGAKVMHLRRERHDAFNAERKAAFLAVLSETSNVRQAAEVAGIHPAIAYRHRRRHADFAAGWDKALADAIADLTMLVAHQGRFGEVSDYTSRIDAEGVRHVRRTRQVAANALRTLNLCAGRAATSDAEDRAAAERREAEIEIEAATRAMMRRIKELSNGGDTQH